MPDKAPEFGWATVGETLAAPNIRALAEAYWQELWPLKEQAPLAINLPEIARQEAMGVFRIWAAHVGGRLVGFIFFNVLPHLVACNTLFAFEVGHYLDPLYREDDHWLGIKMWRLAMTALEDMGVKVVVAHDNADHPLGTFFRRLGFTARATAYWKAL